MRGEYQNKYGAQTVPGELPPRARRILLVSTLAWACSGTTSACAENTRRSRKKLPSPWNYLRVRGEYLRRMLRTIMVSELPPRARRIRLTTDCMQYSMGTTSACAENTQRIARFAINKRNYLRVRGEYATPPPCETRHTELPPRARRIPAPITFCENQCGTTSACAENTSGVYQNILRNRNYLRVRGEYATSPFLSWYSWELPPRARRIPRCLKIMALAVGTTSACAENTTT